MTIGAGWPGPMHVCLCDFRRPERMCRLSTPESAPSSHSAEQSVEAAERPSGYFDWRLILSGRDWRRVFVGVFEFEGDALLRIDRRVWSLSQVRIQRRAWVPFLRHVLIHARDATSYSFWYPWWSGAEWPDDRDLVSHATAISRTEAVRRRFVRSWRLVRSGVDLESEAGQSLLNKE